MERAETGGNRKALDAVQGGARDEDSPCLYASSRHSSFPRDAGVSLLADLPQVTVERVVSAALP